VFLQLAYQFLPDLINKKCSYHLWWQSQGGVLGASAPLQFSTINQEVEEKNEEEEEEKRGGRKKRRKMSLSKSKF